MGDFSQIRDVGGEQQPLARRGSPPVVTTTPARPVGRLRRTWQSVPRPSQQPGSADRGLPFTPVRGVTLELFADIARVLASGPNTGARGSELAASYRISTNDWLHACRVWNARIADNPAVARRLMVLYRDHVNGVRTSRAS